MPKSSRVRTSRCSACVRCSAGCWTTPIDQQPNAHPVVVVSAAFWRNRLGGRADIVGTKITINRHPMTVIGVADPQFHGIDWGGVTAIWLPTMMKRQATPEFDWLFDRRGSGCTSSAA
jgi:hypothetical protein